MLDIVFRVSGLFFELAFDFFESLFAWNGVRVPLVAIDEEFGMFSIFKTLFSVGSDSRIYICAFK